MLEVANLSLSYGAHLAVEGVSLRIDAGECVVILGANGAGKSSLLRAITGIRRAHSGGCVTYRDRNILALRPHRLLELGIAHVPEGRGVFIDMTVADNLLLGLNPRRARDGSQAARRQEVLEMFPRLGERLHQQVGTMSGGEQQMVAIARALLSKPDLLLLDEPSLGLAPIMTKELFASLAKVKARGTAMLLVEQNVSASLALADRGYLLEAGRIVGEDSAVALSTSDKVRSAFLGH
jgi:branched-chain amino acid transport system ATP-binding protein